MKKRSQQTTLFAAAAILVMVVVALAQARKAFNTPVVAVGAAAPGYDLPDQNGIIHTLAADKGKVTLLAFYPADFTGGCTIEAHSLTEAYPQLAAMGVTVYGVSVQDSTSHKSFCSKEGIPYTLLADTQKAASKAYGVLIPGVGIANRVTFIIGADGQIAYVDKSVNSHLNTCGADWVAWIKTHNINPFPTLRDSMNMNRAVRLTATVGKPAPNFLLPDTATGKMSSLTKSLFGKRAVVVMFISTRCPVSNSYNERMSALAKQYAAQGVAFVGIDANTTEPTQEIAEFVKEKNFPFPVLKDADDRAANAYNARVTPETYVINDKGILVYHGRIDNAMDPADVKTHELSDAIDSTLTGQRVAKARQKPSDAP